MNIFGPKGLEKLENDRNARKADFDRLLNKALQGPSVGGGCVIPITLPYLKTFV